MPTERFVAATVASINFTDCTINIWNGGGPDAFFVDNDGKVLRTWKSLNPALGILSNDQFDNRTETFQWPEDGQFFMCSDGLIEAENANREAYGKARLVNVLSSIPRQERFSSVVQSIKQHLGGAISSDDISLIAVDCVKNRAETSEPKHAVEPPVATSPTQRSLWKLNLTLTSEELRSFDALPVIMGWLDQLKLSQKERGEVYTILAELFSNALDHGVLALDSSLKNQPDGFDRYMDQRSARLASLQNGQIEIGFECQQHGEIKFLRLLVKDSGKGFDVQHRLSVDISGNTGLAGRGIALVKSLTTDLEYRGNGNEAIAFYQLD